MKTVEEITRGSGSVCDDVGVCCLPAAVAEVEKLREALRSARRSALMEAAGVADQWKTPEAVKAAKGIGMSGADILAAQLTAKGISDALRSLADAGEEKKG